MLQSHLNLLVAQKIAWKGKKMNKSSLNKLLLCVFAMTTLGTMGCRGFDYDMRKLFFFKTRRDVYLKHNLHYLINQFFLSKAL